MAALEAWPRGPYSWGSSCAWLASEGLPRHLRSWLWVLGVVPVELECCWGQGPPGVPGGPGPFLLSWGRLAALSMLWLPFPVPLSLDIKCPVETISLVQLPIHSIHSPDLYSWPTQGPALGQARGC